LAAALAVYGLTRVLIPPGLLTIGAAVAVLLLGLGVSGIAPAAIGWVLGLIGIAYAVSLYAVGAPIDPLAPAVAGGLLLVGELSYWSLELRRPASGRALISVRRALSIAGLTAATGVMGSLILLVASLPLAGSLLTTMAGAAAALGALALVMVLARRLAG
jgi:hypothetical protein